ncbi:MULTISPECIES: hypothetical protein [unclassified Sphingobacterium]|nr:MULTISPECIES: hypothetical protein [unclassified Sphingobacterium]
MSNQVWTSPEQIKSNMPTIIDDSRYNVRAHVDSKRTFISLID